MFKLQKIYDVVKNFGFFLKILYAFFIFGALSNCCDLLCFFGALAYYLMIITKVPRPYCTCIYDKVLNALC